MSFLATGSPEATRKASMPFQAHGDIGGHGRVSSVRSTLLLPTTTYLAICSMTYFYLDFNTDALLFVGLKVRKIHRRWSQSTSFVKARKYPATTSQQG